MGRAAGWVAVALMVSLPLVFWPPAFGPFHAVKWLVVLVLVPLGLALCACGGLLRWPRWQWFLAWIAVSVLATVFGVAPWMSLFGSPNRNAGLLGMAVVIGAFVLGASVGRDPLFQRRVLRAAVLTGAVVGILAVAERFGLDIAGLGDAGEITRARSTWGSATFAGAYLVIVAPIAVAHMRSRDPRWRVTALVCSIVMAAGLVATGTRAAWLAAGVAAVITLPAWRTTAPGSGGREHRGNAGVSRSGSQPRGSAPRAGLPRWIVPVVVALAVVVAGIFMVPQLGRSSGEGRIDLWSTSVSVIADRPILGSGPDTQRVVLPAGIDVSFERVHGSEELHDRAHSLPLDTLVTTGLLGLIALGALLVVLARDIGSNLRRELVPTAIAAGLGGYLVTLLFAFGDPVLDPIPWLLVGLLWTAVVPQSSPERATAPRAMSHAGATATASIFAVLAFAGALWGGREVLAEQHLQSAMDMRNADDLSGALEELDSAARLAPARFDLDQIASRLVTQALTTGPDPSASQRDRDEMVADAFGRLDRARSIAGDQDPDVLMDRAELLTATGDAQGALEVYDRVLVAYPSSFRAHLGLGLAASELNQIDRAEQAWVSAAELAPDDARAQVNLGILYERRGDPDAAAESFEAALQIDPDNAAATSGLARVTAPPSN